MLLALLFSRGSKWICGHIDTLLLIPRQHKIKGSLTCTPRGELLLLSDVMGSSSRYITSFSTHPREGQQASLEVHAGKMCWGFPPHTLSPRLLSSTPCVQLHVLALSLHIASAPYSSPFPLAYLLSGDADQAQWHWGVSFPHPLFLFIPCFSPV